MMPMRISQTDAAAVAADAFVFGYPLVLMHLMQVSMTDVAAPDPARMRAPINRLVHARELPAVSAGDPDGPRADTLRSSAWLDLAEGPLLLTVPETHGRFYVMSMIDLWTHVFASVGARTTGTAGGTYAIAAPGSSLARLPADALSIVAPTRMVKLAGLLQVDPAGGEDEAHAVQDGFVLEPLEPRRDAGAPPAPARHTPPVTAVERMEPRAFFGLFARLLRDNPPRLEDRPMVDRMRALGLLTAGDLDWQRLGRDVRRAVEAGAGQGLDRVVAAAEAAPGVAVGQWRVRFRLGEFGTDYPSRAGAACAGLEPGPAADELPALLHTDSEGRPLTGRDKYVLRFGPGQLPPVHALWTLTTFDDRQALVDNPVERYSTGDWNGLTLDPDGSLAIRIQHVRPAARSVNWLPAPPGPFNLLLRLCWPQEEVLDRRWAPPPVLRAD
jgi:hypothetical protein